MKGKERRQKRDKEMPCQVCFQGNYEEGMLERIVCIGCERSVHRNCYLPEVRGKFKCDECKQQTKNKDTRITCSTCGNDSGKGLMKNVGNDQFMHIYCAFASNRTRLANYKTLTFLTSDKPSLRKTNGRNRCVNCNFDKCAGLSCTVEGCPNFSHLTCVLNPTKQKESEEEYSSFLTIGLLDKHENSLLSHILSNKDLQGEFKGLDLLLSHKKVETRYFVCTEHNLEEFFNWCTCTETIINGRSIECEICKRWLHSDCDSFDKQCSGCTKNNIYKKNVKLPELIEKALEVETCSQLDKAHIKYLDHFCLKLSEDLVKIVSKNSFEVERYYLRKVLESSVIDESISKLEVIYYLVKKQLKQQSDITPSDIEEILSVLFSKNSKYEVKDKSEKVEKRQKAFLEGKLKQLQKDGTQGIKVKLNQLIKKSEESNINDKELAKDLFELVTHLQASQGWKETYKQFPDVEGEKHIIQFFYEMKFSAQEVEMFLSTLRVILKSKTKGYILESDYELIAPIINKSPADGKTKIFTSVVKNLMKGLVLRRTYKQKQLIKADLESKIKTCKNWKERQGIRTSIISNNILISSKSPIVQFEKDSAQISVLRRMILRKYQDPTPSKLQQAQSFINKLLEIDSRIRSLKDSQRKQFQQMKHRFAFYSKIYNFVRDDSEMDIEPSGSSESMIGEEGEEGEKGLDQDKKIQRPASSYPIKQWVTPALTDWSVEEPESILFGIAELGKLALNRVEFQQKERQVVNTFAQRIVDCYNRQIEVGMRSAGTMVAKLGRIVTYAKIEDRFAKIIGLNNKYIEWKKQLDSKFPDISQTLESAKASSDLLRIVEAKLEEAKEIELDLSSEVRKLKAIRMWVILSQKLHPQHKATIASIQQTKALMDRIFYPSNALRKKVEALESESRSLNKRIGHFLEKPKVGEQQIYEEMKLMDGKMELKDGEELRHDLNISQLDVQMELEELIEEIKQYKNFPKDLKKLADDTSNLEDLLTIRRRIFENSFRLQSLDDYHYLLMRITRLKCSEYSVGAPITKKEYFKFINYAGQSGSDLYTETAHLLKAYKEVEKAEKELLSLKPKIENLLPTDCKKVRDDLRDDPVELQKVNKWWNASQKAKERFRAFRSLRPDYSQLIMIENELLRIPINNRQTLHQIGKIKKELDQLTNKIRLCIGDKVDQTTVLESPYLQGHFMHYHSIGVRTEFLGRFEMLYQKNKHIMETARKLTTDTYGIFRAMCEDSYQLCQNNEVYKAREDAFNKMTEVYLESNEPLMQIGITLLGEGGYLLKYPNKATDILNKLIAINQKFNKWREPSRQAVPKQLSSEEASPEESQPNEESDMEDQESAMMDDLDNDDDFSDSESQEPENRKRARPATNEVVQLDDD